MLIVYIFKVFDIFDYEMENVLGLIGFVGNFVGYLVVMKCDVLLMFVIDFFYDEFLFYGIKII